MTAILIQLLLFTNYAHATEVTLYADTRLFDPVTQSYVRARLDHVSPDNLEQIELRTQEGVDILRPANDQPAEVTLFLPHKLSLGAEQTFVNEIERPLRHRFQHATIVVKHAKSYSPQQADLAMGSAIGAAKSIIWIGSWIGTSGVNRYRLGQTLVSIAMSQILNRYPTQINRWEVEHKIPFGQNRALIQFYNNHPLVKTIIINEAINFPLNAVLRQLSHWDNPLEVHPVFSKQYLIPYVLAGLVLGPLSATGDVGVMKLMHEGYISPRTAQYTYSGMAFLGLASTIFWAKELKGWWFAVVSAEMLVRGGIAGIARYLPPPPNRLVIVHPETTAAEREQIEYVYNLKNIFLDPETVARSSLCELQQGHSLTVDADCANPN